MCCCSRYILGKLFSEPPCMPERLGTDTTAFTKHDTSKRYFILDQRFQFNHSGIISKIELEAGSHLPTSDSPWSTDRMLKVQSALSSHFTNIRIKTRICQLPKLNPIIKQFQLCNWYFTKLFFMTLLFPQGAAKGFMKWSPKLTSPALLTRFADVSQWISHTYTHHHTYT